MPITLNNSNISVQYNTGSNYIIETVKSDLYRKNEINLNNIITNNLQTAPVTPTTFVDNNGNVYAVESYTYSGSANTTDFTRVFPKNTTCDILIVGGGGGGAKRHGGGGGAGTLLYHKNVILNGSYNIKVGKGGSGVKNGVSYENGSTTVASSGTFSQFIKNDGTQEYYANGGGKGGGWGGPGAGVETNGGSTNSSQIVTLPLTNKFNGQTVQVLNNEYVNTLTSPEGCRGNKGGIEITSYKGGGGGGAGGTGMNHDSEATVNDGYGGLGLAIDITGASAVYAGGGNGSDFSGSVSQVFNPLYSTIQSRGGGGFGSDTGSGQDGLNGTGGGGGGQGNDVNGVTSGAGGSGIVIIRYLLGTVNYLTTEPTVIVPSFTESIRTFIHSGGAETQTSYNITVGQNTICDILIVGGGGGGGLFGGGGGSGSILFANNLLLNVGSYVIKVGKGGIGASNDTANGTNGIDTSITINAIEYIAKGGGGGGSRNNASTSYAGRNGSSGGSGGGSSQSDTIETFGGSSTINTYQNWETYGNAGGKGKPGATPWVSGGGGGAGSAGSDWSNTKGGNGGSGKNFVSYFGTNVGHNGWFGGGGGGNVYWPSGTYYDYGYGNGGNGLFGGGGNGANESTVEISATSGLPNTGGGGGGGKWDGTAVNGGNGGSGIVIIKFKSTTTISEGNPITHKRLNFTYNNDNLVAWYRFNGDYLDSSGNGHNLTNVGSVIQSTHIIEGQAVEFDSTDYLEFPTTINPYTIWNGKGITFSFWVRYTTNGLWARLFDFQTASNSTSGILIAFKESSQNLRIHVTSSYYFDTVIVNSGTWNHIVWCIDVTGKWDIYLNNVRINNSEVQGIPNITYNFRYIRKSASTNDGTWNGQMDDFRIYDRVLSATDVSLLYNKTYPIPNLYTLNFPVPTVADINNNSNIVLRGAYDISLSTTSSLIIPKAGQYIPRPTTFATSNMLIRYNLLNPTPDPIGAQWTYNSSNTSVYHMGSVGIGTTNPEYQLDVRGNIYSSTGGFTQSGLTTWTVLSDRRIKENVVKASYEKCLENVKNIELYNFNFKENYVSTNDRHQLGFIAQEVQAVYPKAVEVGKIILNLEEKIDDLLTLNTTQIDYTLYGAVKGLIQKMENIKIKIEQIKGTSNITT